MRKLYKYLLVVALICSTLVTKAQNDGIGFTMLPQMPFANYYNPGAKLPYLGVAGGLGFSNFNVSEYNSSLKYKNLFGSDKSKIDAVKFVNSLGDDNDIRANFSMDLINAGFKVKRLYFSLDWRMRMESNLSYSKDFLGLFVFGNAHYMNDPCDFKVGMDVTMFAEYALGVQWAVNDKLTLGVRPKFLSGIANVHIASDETRIYTDPDSYAITADIDFNIKAATILKVDVTSMKDIIDIIDTMDIKNMLDIKENVGFGVDFGAEYVFNEHWGVSAGVYDLGYIKWRNSKEKTKKNTNVLVHDVLFDNYHDLTDFELDYKSMLGDVIDDVWGNDTLTIGDDYKTSLTTRFMMQGYYELNPMVRFTALGQLYFVDGKMKPALTLAYSGLFWNHVNVTVNGTLSKYTGSSFGLGLGLHFGAFNFFLVSDNILCLAKVGTPALELASSYRSANIRTGIIFTIGKYPKAKKAEKVEKELIEEKVIDTDEIDKEKEEFIQQNSDDLE